MRAAGVADPEAAPVHLCETLQADSIGTWLPFALADLLRIQCAKPPKLADILRSWGLTFMADRIEAAETEKQTDAVIAAFGG